MTSSRILKIAQLWPSSEPQGRGREPLWLFWVKWCISRRNSWTGRGAIHNVILQILLCYVYRRIAPYIVLLLYTLKKRKKTKQTYYKTEKIMFEEKKRKNITTYYETEKIMFEEMLWISRCLKYTTHERQIILNFMRNLTLDTFLNMYLIVLCILTGLRSVDLKGANVATSRKTRNSAETLFCLTPITVCLVSLSCWNLHTI